MTRITAGGKALEKAETPRDLINTGLGQPGVCTAARAMKPF